MTTILLWIFAILGLLISINALIVCLLAWNFINEMRTEEKRLKEEDEFFERKKNPIDIEDRGNIIGWAVYPDGTKEPLYCKPKYHLD